MAFTQTQLDTLKEMLASGILESGHGSEKIKFDSFEGLKMRIDMITRSLATASNRIPRTGAIRFRGC